MLNIHYRKVDVPALILGGKPAIENVDKGDAATHMHLLFELGK